MLKKGNGFTIVELLIVIVVIAILAAITLIGYNGIQTRAYNSSTSEMISQARTAIDSHKTIHGSLPLSSSPGTNACLGNGYPNGNCGSIQYSGTCPAGLTNSTTDESAQFDTAIKATVSSGLPAIIHPPMILNASFSGCNMAITMSGPTYMTYTYVTNYGTDIAGTFIGGAPSAGAYIITYYLKGDGVRCPIGVNAPTEPGWTVCKLGGGDVRAP
jgi:prepilin-type N-terminal cleavage/methylation domain-containing protein